MSVKLHAFINVSICKTLAITFMNKLICIPPWNKTLPFPPIGFFLRFLKYMKEACRTSVLSHRWKHLWSFFIGSLDFYDRDTIWDMLLEKIKLKSARKKYVKRVNRVLKSHRGSTIDEFRVCFELDKRFKRDIDGWTDFAFSKRVKRLELDFTSCGFDMSYTFPHERFMCSGVSSLISLTLIRVHVKSKLLQHFITNCPLLERLLVDSSKDLVNLKVCSSSLKLNYLHIVDCSEFKVLRFLLLILSILAMLVQE